MKPPRLDIIAPTTVSEALAALASDDARALAGGQSLVPILALRLAYPKLLVDLNRIPALAGIRANGTLAIGAMTRHRAVERNAAVAHANPLLAAAMPWIAHVPIRNRGTIGGSLAHADPAAELPAVCLACDATLIAQGPAGERRIPAQEFFLGTFTTALGSGELLTRVEFDAWPANRRAGFIEIARRHGDFALCGIATTLDRSGAAVARARVVAFGVAERPIRLEAVERALVGSDGSPRAIEAAARHATDGLETRGDHHASAEYRKELAVVLTRRALLQG